MFTWWSFMKNFCPIQSQLGYFTVTRLLDVQSQDLWGEKGMTIFSNWVPIFLSIRYFLTITQTCAPRFQRQIFKSYYCDRVSIQDIYLLRLHKSHCPSNRAAVMAQLRFSDLGHGCTCLYSRAIASEQAVCFEPFLYTPKISNQILPSSCVVIVALLRYVMSSIEP